MIARYFLLMMVFVVGAAAAVAAEPSQVVDVWPRAVPGETGPPTADTFEQKPNLKLVTSTSQPTLSIFRPAKDVDTGAAVVICPGGGYAVLAWDLEGEEVAQWLNSIGVTGIVLKYRVPSRPGKPRHELPLQDAQRALSMVRSNAPTWGIDPQRIGLLGFSAGGNLTAIAATNYDQRAYNAIDDVDKVSCRPDFAVLVYPAWLAQDGKDELVPEVRVTERTPQTFLTFASDDLIQVTASTVLYRELLRAKVPAEMHVYTTGGHGYGLRPSDRPCSKWPQRCEEWLRSQKLLDKPAGG